VSEPSYSTNVGDLLVVWLTGMTGSYVAEVTQGDPLRLKVSEDGPLAHLKTDDVIIRGGDSAMLQKDSRDDTGSFLEQEQAAGRKVMTGLASLGVEGGQLHEISPAE